MKNIDMNYSIYKKRIKFNLLIKFCLFLIMMLSTVTMIICGNNTTINSLTEPPTDYGNNYEVEKIDSLEVNSGSFEGIIKSGDKSFVLVYNLDENVNGLITLARISQNDSLKGYTFNIAFGTSVSLNIKYENNNPILNESFFGIGNSKFPFKGNIIISGAADTSIYMEENNWGCLFNNLSNEASIISASNNFVLHSACKDINDTEVNKRSFMLARKITITENNKELNISGFRFGESEGTTIQGAYVIDDDNVGLVAGSVQPYNDATSFSIDLTNSITNGKYIIKSKNGIAGGLIGHIEKNANVEIALPNNYNFEVSSNTNNAGLLIGTNNGSISFSNDANHILNGTVSSPLASGLIGENNDNASVLFNNNISITLNSEGAYCGGLVGYNHGTIRTNDVTINNSSLKATNALGGFIGISSSNDENGGIVINGNILLNNNTLNSEKALYVGGLIGSLITQEDMTLENINVCNTINYSTSSNNCIIGGLIGYLQANGNFKLKLNDKSKISIIAKSGTIGGIIANIDSTKDKMVLIEGNGTTNDSLELNLNIKANSNVYLGGIAGKIKGYTKINNLKLINTFSSQGMLYYAKIAHIVLDDSILDIGNINLKETSSIGTTLVNKVGESKTGVVRLNGAIDDTSTNIYHIVREQNSSLIYKDINCSYNASSSKYNDIGNYGQIIRNDILKIINFNDATHEISIKEPIDARGAITLDSKEALAKLAISFYTKGEISGVEGATYSQLFTKSINITNSISLSNTGIEQITPSNNNSNSYQGTINGNNNTITLAIGEDINGNIVRIKSSKMRGVEINARSYLGLFASIHNATINNLTINGKISSELLSFNQYIGAFASCGSGNIKINNCKTDIEIAIVNGSNTDKKEKLYVGGMIASIDNCTLLNVNNCTFSANIDDSSNYSGNNLSYGGFSAVVLYNGTSNITFSSNSIKTTIKKSNSSNEILKIGGLIATLTCNNYSIVDLNGTNADVSINVANGASEVGGILGYEFNNCKIDVNNHYTGNINVNNASIGGLITNLNGRLNVNNGFKLDNINIVSQGNNRGLLLANGTNALIIINVDPSAFNNHITALGFDLFVGKNIESYSSVDIGSKGGIVSIETGSGEGLLPNSSGWYDLIKDRENTKTRYYFNIAALENKTNINEAINNPIDLLYWSVYSFAKNSLNSNVSSEFFKCNVNNITSALKDIDMTNYCFYPSYKESVIIDLSNKTLTLGTSIVESKNQFFGIQTGIISDIHSKSATTNSTIQNIKIAGIAKCIDENSGSGALICGTVYGSISNSKQNIINLTIKNITISGIKADNNYIYRPLIVNQFGSYIDVIISGIQEDKDKYPSDSKVAASLFGRGGILSGNSQSSFIKMVLSNIKLDGKSDSSIFANSTLFYDVSYVSGTGSITYNFTFAEDWDNEHNVTYGAELELNENQRMYFDKDIYVNPLERPTEASNPYLFSENYLFYVFVKTTGETTNLNLSVNRKSSTLTTGWGTYKHPYIISSSSQLEDLSNWLSGNNVSFANGWEINFPKDRIGSVTNWNKDTTSANKLTNLSEYSTIRSYNGILKNSSGVVLQKKLLLDYLSGAYFKLASASEFTLSASYSGIGSVTYPFHGVIDGSGRVIHMPTRDNKTPVDENGFGFINVASGCAIYNLTASYETVSLSNQEFNEKSTNTSNPTEKPSTSIPHFGGIIARIAGGDNLLDEVKVYINNEIDSGAMHSASGGYVGLITGGGVLLNNIEVITSSKFNKDNRLYHNNYIGRVIQGYAMAIDGIKYNNSKEIPNLSICSDYDIPALHLNDFISHKKGYNNGTFTIENKEDLLILSMGMNSGAFRGIDSSNFSYGPSSLSRFGNYSHIGSDIDGFVDSNEKYIDDNNRISLLASYFNITEDILNKDISIQLTSNTEYDLTEYGNSMRGISGIYSNSPLYKINYIGCTNSVTIKLNMNMYQYVNTTSDSKAIFQPDSILSYGLFGQINSDFIAENVMFNGKLSLQYIDINNVIIEKNYFNALDINSNISLNNCSVGALIGRTPYAINLANVCLNNMEVISPDIAGGIIGLQFLVKNASTNNINDITINNSSVHGRRNAGGIIGYFRNNILGNVNVTNININNSIIENIFSIIVNKQTQYVGTGGVFGVLEGNDSTTTNIQISNCSILKTAIVYYSWRHQDVAANRGAVGSGGIIGVIKTTNKHPSKQNVSFTGCTINGCVVFALGNTKDNMYSTSYHYDVVPNSSITNSLSEDFKSKLVYNGEKQSSVKVIAYLLSQNSNNRNGWGEGTAGGFIGYCSANLKFDNCNLLANAAPVAIAGTNSSSGIVGEIKAGMASFELKNTSIKTNGHDMFIISYTRSAGVIVTTDSNNTNYVINNLQIAGTNDNPIRIIASKFQSSEAGGLFASFKSNSTTISNCKLTNCIISASYASGFLEQITTSTNNMYSFYNIHLENNVIYNKSAQTGSLFRMLNSNLTINLNGAYIGNNYIAGNGKGTGTMFGTNNAILNAKYVIFEDNRISNGSINNYLFTTYKLNNAKDYLSSNLKNLDASIIGYSNTGQLNVIALSAKYSDANFINKEQKNIYSFSTGKEVIVYAAYNAYRYYTYKEVVNFDSNLTPQEEAIAKISYSILLDKNANTIYGDSTFAGNPSSINALKWYEANKEYIFDGTSLLITLKDKNNGFTINERMIMVNLTTDIDNTLKNYINMLTNNGFKQAYTNNKVNVKAIRYYVDENGALTTAKENGKELEGSVVFENNKFYNGVYDSLDETNKTITILYLEFLDANDNIAYTMHIPLFYQRSISMKIFVKPVEGEEYYLPSFIDPNSEPRVNALQTSVSFASPFTLYVEYNYDRMINELGDDFSNFKKVIELTTPGGISDENAKIEKDTSFILIDLNSSSPKGYKYYKLKLDKDERFIRFESFTDFGLVNLQEIKKVGEKLANDKRICKDTNAEGCIYCEKYLLVVFPVNSADENTMTYNMKATIDEEQRKETNITVKANHVIGQISLWGSPKMNNTSSYINNQSESKLFSNKENEKLEMNVNSSVIIKNDYVTSLQSTSKSLYSTHVIQLRNDTTQKYVDLPKGTIVNITSTNGKVYANTSLEAKTTQIKFSAGNILSELGNADKIYDDNNPSKILAYQYNTSYKISLDFSNVSNADFNIAFNGSDSTKYSLFDSLYLSRIETSLGNGPVDTHCQFTAIKNTSVKMVVVPTNNQNLGINLEKKDDVTNNGIIDFIINVNYQDFENKVFNDVTISFELKKKIYNSASNTYEYIPATTKENSIWSISKNGISLTKTPIDNTLPNDEQVFFYKDSAKVVNKEVNEKYTLKVNVDDANLELTNYMLFVNVKSNENVDITANDYFVFLICRLNVDK